MIDFALNYVNDVGMNNARMFDADVEIDIDDERQVDFLCD